ncbi:MAG: hypothetical protein LBJ63_07700 [Prevotellaceae bacterium]|jgi:hypothetical protein|nr:hypothetical protein [Prevotellaceae bacterium]
MSTKDLQLVNLEQAKRLKELGFDLETIEFYHEDGTADMWIFGDHNAAGKYSAPTVALALKYIRDEKGKIFTIKWDYLGGGDYNYYYIIEYKNNIPIVGFSTKCYYVVENQLLDRLLSILEKEKEQ